MYGNITSALRNKYPQITTQEVVKMSDIVLDVLTKESKNKDLWNKRFKNAIPGIFYKELMKLSKNKNTGFEIEEAHPLWSETPLIKVNITDDNKLTPVMWKKNYQK